MFQSIKNGSYSTFLRLCGSFLLCIMSTARTPQKQRGRKRDGFKAANSVDTIPEPSVACKQDGIRPTA